MATKNARHPKGFRAFVFILVRLLLGLDSAFKLSGPVSTVPTMRPVIPLTLAAFVQNEISMR
ncbi:MAG: hypothetical protein DMG68_21915 [Acidobacteria bacterium]|nr:MAG: hypothetical protein DMG68_21915 [Acidobacteriota bacterium]